VRETLDLWPASGDDAPVIPAFDQSGKLSALQSDAVYPDLAVLVEQGLSPLAAFVAHAVRSDRVKMNYSCLFLFPDELFMLVSPSKGTIGFA